LEVGVSYERGAPVAPVLHTGEGMVAQATTTALGLHVHAQVSALMGRVWDGWARLGNDGRASSRGCKDEGSQCALGRTMNWPVSSGYSRANISPWEPFPPEAGPSRTRPHNCDQMLDDGIQTTTPKCMNVQKGLQWMHLLCATHTRAPLGALRAQIPTRRSVRTWWNREL